MLVRTIKKFPEQVFLFLFNTGVFTWLKMGSQTILDHLGIDSQAIMSKVPESIHALTGNNLENLKTLIEGSPWIWLIVSMGVLILIRFVKGLIKFVLFVAIILIGLYLLMKNQDLVNLVVSKF
ncbi:hypothetical protein [Streptococcus zalophi]|uniref:Uncharacterized protein n=1 Tax=Streptococcus zalophi TaxID=640031 RepID=A0A934P9B2_9STRE|nr:hypothetical protein [Streptococcus zalophi]MBJ8349342.1 hypothetical protein [Streptococcus zalophi]MCR8967463.1 hypothetical protein [Streptococcus zalophi]